MFQGILTLASTVHLNDSNILAYSLKLSNCDCDGVTRDLHLCYTNLTMQGDPSLPLLTYPRFLPVRSLSATIPTWLWQSLISMVADCDLTGGRLGSLSSCKTGTAIHNPQLPNFCLLNVYLEKEEEKKMPLGFGCLSKCWFCFVLGLGWFVWGLGSSAQHNHLFNWLWHLDLLCLFVLNKFFGIHYLFLMNQSFICSMSPWKKNQTIYFEPWRK